MRARVARTNVGFGIWDGWDEFFSERLGHGISIHAHGWGFDVGGS